VASPAGCLERGVDVNAIKLHHIQEGFQVGLALRIKVEFPILILLLLGEIEPIQSDHAVLADIAKKGFPLLGLHIIQNGLEHEDRVVRAGRADES
jgi:hypothetical protein